jgi:hypothetical protein
MYIKRGNVLDQKLQFEFLKSGGNVESQPIALMIGRNNMILFVRESMKNHLNIWIVVYGELKKM